MQLTQEQRDQVQRRLRANILAKLKSGKTISAREQTILDGDDSRYVRGQENLAAALSLDRKTIQNIIKKYPDRELPGKKRGAESDGRFCVPDWRIWIEAHGIRGRGKNNPELEDERAVRLDILKVQRDRQRFELERERERMLPVAQFEAALAKTISAFLAALNAFGPRVNESLEGLDFNDRALVIENEVELLRKTLASCHYLEMEEPEDDD